MRLYTFKSSFCSNLLPKDALSLFPVDIIKFDEGTYFLNPESGLTNCYIVDLDFASNTFVLAVVARN